MSKRQLLAVMCSPSRTLQKALKERYKLVAARQEWLTRYSGRIFERYEPYNRKQIIEIDRAAYYYQGTEKSVSARYSDTWRNGRCRGDCPAPDQQQPSPEDRDKKHRAYYHLNPHCPSRFLHSIPRRFSIYSGIPPLPRVSKLRDYVRPSGMFLLRP